MDSQTARYGVLGVGALATAIVTGLCEGVAEPPAVVLSPRNARAAAALAARHATVAVATDNQAVLDGATSWSSACATPTPTCSGS